MKNIYESLKDLSSQIEMGVIDFTQSLVRTPNSGLNTDEIAMVIKKEMEGLEYDKVFIDSVGNVIGMIYGSDPQSSVLLTSHMDTPEPISNYHLIAPKLEPELKGRQLYGNGIANCKAGIAAQVYAAALIKRSQVLLDRNLIVAATIADEGGLCLGVRNLLRSTLPYLGNQPLLAVLGDPTDLGVYIGNDGWIQVDIHLESDKLQTVKDVAFEVVKYFQEKIESYNSVHKQAYFPIPKPQFNRNSCSSQTDIFLLRRLYAKD